MTYPERMCVDGSPVVGGTLRTTIVRGRRMGDLRQFDRPPKADRIRSMKSKRAKGS